MGGDEFRVSSGERGRRLARGGRPSLRLGQTGRRFRRERLGGGCARLGICDARLGFGGAFLGIRDARLGIRDASLRLGRLRRGCGFDVRRFRVDGGELRLHLRDARLCRFRATFHILGRRRVRGVRVERGVRGCEFGFEAGLLLRGGGFGGGEFGFEAGLLLRGGGFGGVEFGSEAVRLVGLSTSIGEHGIDSRQLRLERVRARLSFLSRGRRCEFGGFQSLARVRERPLHLCALVEGGRGVGLRARSRVGGFRVRLRRRRLRRRHSFAERLDLGTRFRERRLRRGVRR